MKIRYQTDLKTEKMLMLLLATAAGIAIFRGGNIGVLLTVDALVLMAMSIITHLLLADRHILAETGALVVLGSLTQSELAANADYISATGYMLHLVLGAGVLVLTVIVGKTGFLSRCLFHEKAYRVMLAASCLFYCIGLVSGRVNGAANWLQLGGLSLQVSEISKMLYILILIHLAERSGPRGVEEETGRLLAAYMVHAIFLILISEGGFLILLTILTGLTLAVCTRDPKKLWNHLIIPVAIGIVCLLAAAVAGGLFLHPMVEKLTSRFAALLHPEEYSLSAGWQTLMVNKGIWTGWLFGSSNIMPVPAVENDMVLAGICNCLGIITGAGVIVLYGALGRTICRVAARTGSIAIFLAGEALIAQAFLNIMGTVGVGPIVGVNLPFISQGGTSMILSMTTFGLIQVFQTEESRNCIEEVRKHEQTRNSHYALWGGGDDPGDSAGLWTGGEGGDPAGFCGSDPGEGAVQEREDYHGIHPGSERDPAGLDEARNSELRGSVPLHPHFERHQWAGKPLSEGTSYPQ